MSYAKTDEDLYVPDPVAGFCVPRSDKVNLISPSGVIDRKNRGREVHELALFLGLYRTEYGDYMQDSFSTHYSAGPLVEKLMGSWTNLVESYDRSAYRLIAAQTLCNIEVGNLHAREPSPEAIQRGAVVCRAGENWKHLHYLRPFRGKIVKVQLMPPTKEEKYIPSRRVTVDEYSQSFNNGDMYLDSYIDGEWDVYYGTLAAHIKFLMEVVLDPTTLSDPEELKDLYNIYASSVE